MSGWYSFRPTWGLPHIPQWIASRSQVNGQPETDPAAIPIAPGP